MSSVGVVVRGETVVTAWECCVSFPGSASLSGSHSVLVRLLLLLRSSGRKLIILSPRTMDASGEGLDWQNLVLLP